MGPKVLAWNGLGGYSFPKFPPSGSCTFSDHYMDNLTSQLHLLNIETLQVLRPLRSAAHEDKLLSSCLSSQAAKRFIVLNWLLGHMHLPSTFYMCQ